MRISTIFTIFLILSLLQRGFSTIRQVPSLICPTIQSAIDASVNGDTVLILPGTYQENINFNSKHILVGSQFITSQDTSYISSTIIDGGGSVVNQSVVSFLGSEDTLSVLKGLTLTNGWASGSHGGGVSIRNGSSPKIEDCVIRHNSGTTGEFRGLGIHCVGSAPVLRRCIIRDNMVTGNGNYDHMGGGLYLSGSTGKFIDCQILGNQIAASIYHRNYGGGIYCTNSSPIIQNCYFAGNSADLGAGIQLTTTANANIYNCIFAYNSARDDGGAVHIGNSSPVLVNNTISRNKAGNRGGGIFSQNSNVVIMNQILWENAAGNGADLFVTGSGTLTVDYSDVKGGWSGTGNIDYDPAFEDTLYFYLSDTSVCIDAGNPDPIYNDPEDPVHPGQALWPAKGGLRNDMGAYGGPRTGNWVFTAIQEEVVESEEVIETFKLFQNYPNPFNLATVIEFQIPKAEKVSLKIFDVLGQEVMQIIAGDLLPGKYRVEWNAAELCSGIYICHLQAGRFVESKKMILLK